MKKMYSEEQLAEIASGALDPTSIPEGEIVDDGIVGINEDNELVKGSLFGKYVRVIDAPEDGKFSQEEITSIKEGVFVNGRLGNVFNPLLFPPYVYSVNEIRGVMISAVYGATGLEVLGYSIDTTTGAFSYGPSFVSFNLFGSSSNYTMRLNYVSQISGKVTDRFLPTYPSETANKNYHPVLSNGTLVWEEGNGLYLHTIVFNVSGGTTVTIKLVSDSNVGCVKDPISSNFVISGASCLIPSNMGSFVLTPFNENGFNPDIHAFNATTGAYSDLITLDSVASDTITPIG